MVLGNVWMDLVHPCLSVTNNVSEIHLKISKLRLFLISWIYIRSWWQEWREANSEVRLGRWNFGTYSQCQCCSLRHSAPQKCCFSSRSTSQLQVTHDFSLYGQQQDYTQGYPFLLRCSPAHFPEFSHSLSFYQQYMWWQFLEVVYIFPVYSLSFSKTL